LIVRLLLDTHVFLWLTDGDARLDNHAKALIDGAERVFVSCATIWEIAIKVRLGKLKVDPEQLIAEIWNNGFEELPVISRHAKAVAKLPRHHGDPFDLLLIAQAINEPLHLLTADAQLAAYSELVVTI
jgi:PIN domain nuclease of toxin-antitoxin system